MSTFDTKNEPGSEGAKLFAATIAAHGGEAFLNVTTLKMTGTGEFMTPPQIGGLTVSLNSFALYIATGGRCRLEAQSPGGPILFVVRGDGQGGFVTVVRRTLPLPAVQTTGMEPTEYLRNVAKQGYPIVARPDTETAMTSDGTPLLRYDILDNMTTGTQVFVEEKTKLVRKLVRETPRGEITLLLSDYRLASGLPVFREVQLLENGASVFKLFVADIIIDEYVKDSLFE